jgi:small subunit ribosomal protein S17
MEAKKTIKCRQGVVIGSSGDKSLRVRIDYTVKHPMYGKYIKRSTKLGVHDEKNIASVGDTVEIAECRPLSKTKNWRLLKVIKKGIVE